MFLAYTETINSSSLTDVSTLINVESFDFGSYERYCVAYSCSYGPNAKVNQSAYFNKIAGIGYLNLFFGGEKVENELYLIESIPISSSNGVLPFSIVGASLRVYNRNIEGMSDSFPYYSPVFDTGKINSISGTIGADAGNGEVSYPIHFEVQESGITTDLPLTGSFGGDVSLNGSYVGSVQGTVTGTAGEQILLGSMEGTGGLLGTTSGDSGGQIDVSEYRPYGFIGTSSGSGLGFANASVDLSALTLGPSIDVLSFAPYFAVNAYEHDFRGCCTHIEVFLPVTVYDIEVVIKVYGLNQV